MANLTEFKCFSNLLQELQDKIWDFALSETHQIIRQTVESPHGYPMWWRTHINRFISPILLVCAGSRARAQERFTERQLGHVPQLSSGSKGPLEYGGCLQYLQRRQEQNLLISPRWPSGSKVNEDQIVGQWWNPDFISIEVTSDPDACLDLSIRGREIGVPCFEVFDWKVKYAALTTKDWLTSIPDFTWLHYSMALNTSF
ncbi:hypothetical protein EG329_002048 [Mollisiaceae sp. DMI_Dod_QoI]|nr:hypothetical protein EG329_002048 [Helotiales sp. DMI_Dod_QoI]